MQSLNNISIAMVGLGYVGLPLAVAFGRQFDVIGFDCDARRIAQLHAGIDSTGEICAEDLAASTRLRCTTSRQALRDCTVFIVTVPTPIDAAKQPNLEPLKNASLTIGKALKHGDVVIYESTVYPGCTEEVCIPLLERASGLKFNHDFFVGYSPERINPGDKKHRLKDIPKLTSGSTPQTADFVDRLYTCIITAGTHKAGSIKVAEAAKIIENAQRDLNIAFVNDMAIFFNRLGIDTNEVLKAAGSKWNFQVFQPGLVGGHCISVDPYYLAYKALEMGHDPAIILAGRRVNNGMGTYIANEVIRLMIRRHINPAGACVLVLGLTFKANCPDLRNTGVIDMVRSLCAFTNRVDSYDPWVDPVQAMREYAVMPIDQPKSGHYDAVVVAVAHQEFIALGGAGVRALGKAVSVIYDVKSILPREAVDGWL